MLLWLPDTVTGVTLNTGTVTVSGEVIADKECRVPTNTFTAAVTVTKDGELWTDDPAGIQLLPVGGSAALAPDGNAAVNGVYTFSGLSPDASYIIQCFSNGEWLQYSAVADQLTKASPTSTVKYSSLTIAKPAGVAATHGEGVYVEGTPSIPVYISYYNNYKITDWLLNDVSQQTSEYGFLYTMTTRPAAFTPVLEPVKFAAKVTVTLDGAAWTANAPTVILAPGNSAAAEGAVTMAKGANGVYTATGLDATKRYYIFATDSNGTVYINKSIIFNSSSPASEVAATADFFTLELTAGSGVTTLGVNGSTVTVSEGGTVTAQVLKGSTVTVAATAAEGAAFRWTDASGALVYTAQSNDLTVNATTTLTASAEVPADAVTVSVTKDGAAWKDCDRMQVLAESSAVLSGLIYGSFNTSTGVITYTGLKANTDYYFWDVNTLTCLNPNTPLKSTGGRLTADYYTLNIASADHVSGVYGGNVYPEGAIVNFSASAQTGYQITGFNVIIGSKTETKSGYYIADYKITGTTTATPIVSEKPFDATVTLKKDGAAWSDGDVTLSTSNTTKTGVKTGTAASGVTTFTNLGGASAYYVWVGDEYVGRTITAGATSAEVNYYTVTLTADSTNFDAPTGGGAYLAGTTATINVTAKSGYQFASWVQTDGGAGFSDSANASLTVDKAYSLTAAAGFTASVTIKKDDAAWTTGAPTLVLSTSSTACESIVTGQLTSGTYSFPGLDLTKSYYVWDTVRGQYTGQTVTLSAFNVTISYYNLTVSGEHAAVSGGGTYLAGSIVTVKADADANYKLTGDWASGSKAVTVSEKTTVTVTAALDTYTGTIIVRKGGNPWTDYAGTLAVSGGTTPASYIPASGVVTIENMDPTKTYAVTIDGTAVAAPSYGQRDVFVDYYTVTATGVAVTASGGGDFLKGSNVTLTASNVESGKQFFGWYSSAGALLWGDMSYVLKNLSADTTLTAKADAAFSATVSLADSSGNAMTAGNTISLRQMTASDTVYGGAFADAAATETNSNGTLSFTGLASENTYGVFDGNTYTGKTVTAAAPFTAVTYYVVSCDQGTGGTTTTYVPAGTDFTLSYTPSAGTTFAGWVAGGKLLSTLNDYTIRLIDKDYTITARTLTDADTKTFTLSDGDSLVIEDSTTGYLVVKQTNAGGTTISTEISAAGNIIITQTHASTEPRDWTAVNATVTVNAAKDVYVTLKDLYLTQPSGANYGIVTVADTTTGDVVLNISGESYLLASGKQACIYKGLGANTLFVTGDKVLNINYFYNTGAVFTSATEAAGIGGSAVTGASRSTRNLTFENSAKILGPVSASSGGAEDKTKFGTLIGGAYQGYARNIVVNSGLIYVDQNITTDYTKSGLGSANGAVTPDDDSISSQPTLIVNGGMVNGTPCILNTDAGDFLVVTGGGVFCSSSAPWKNAYGQVVTRVRADPDSTTVKRNYAGVPVDAKGVPYGTAHVSDASFLNFAQMNNDASNYHTVNVPTAQTVNGVTGWADVSNLYRYVGGETVPVTVRLSGTAILPGAFTLTLKRGETVVGEAKTIPVSAGQTAAQTYALSFDMPADADVSDLTLSLVFAETGKHTVSYTAPGADGGSVPAGDSCYEGESYTVPGNTGSLTKAGYTFAGWYSGDTEYSGIKTMGTANVTLTAKWTPNTYTVTFHDGSDTKNQTLTYDAAANLTANSFANTGHSFIGWATAAGGAVVYTDSASVTNLAAAKDAVVNLHAVWTPLTYTATFDGNGATSGTTAGQSFSHGVAQNLTPNGFTKTGYTFAGWKNDTNNYANGQSVSLTANATFTAQWTANTYTVVFDGNGATGGATANQTLTYGRSQTLSESGFTRSGYTFAGWAKTKNGVALTAAAVHNLTAVSGGTVTLYALWANGTYQITFNGNGATGGATSQETMTYNVSKALTESGFTRTGYDFAGWALAAADTVPVYTDKQSVTEIMAPEGGTNFTGAVTLYAVWNPAAYTVSFNGNGNTNSVTMGSEVFYHNTAKALPMNLFEKTGYTFKGWAASSNAAAAQHLNAASATFTSNIQTLYAVWAENSYTVAFDANGGNGSMADESFTYTQSKALTANTLTRTGYTFTGWNTKDDGTGTAYAGGATVSKLTAANGGAVTLYALWTANTYTVTLHGNFTGAGDNTVDTFTYDAAPKALTANSFTRAGYAFTGWNTVANGNGTTYGDRQQIYNLTAEKDKNTDLYAVWVANATSLSFDANGGTGSMADQIIVTGAAGVLSANKFLKTGYTFTGWNTEANGSGTAYAALSDVATLNNVTVLYAQWTPVSYTIAYDANGATSGSAPDDQTLTYDTGLALRGGSGLSKAGSSFTGWSESSAADAATYAAGATISAVSALPGGTVTLYAVWKSTTYTLNYSANGGEGTIDSATKNQGEQVTLTPNTFTREGYAFTGWNTRPDGGGTAYVNNASLTPIANALGQFTLYAQWAKSDLTGLSGTVKTGDNAVAGAAVLVQQGDTMAASATTDAAGKYQISNLKPGIYNMVVVSGGKACTQILTVTADNAGNTVTANADIAHTSRVNLESDAGVAVPETVVGGLNELASSIGSDYILTIRARAEDKSSTEQNAIRILSGQGSAEYLDITLSKDGQKADESGTVLEFVQLFDFSGKNNIKVLRYHDGAAESFTELKEKPASGTYADATFFADREGGRIYIYASKFSTYSITYTTASGGGAAPVIVSGATGGAAAISPASPSAGQAVTVTLTPSKGYKVGGVTVTDQSGKAVAATENADGTWSFTMPAGSVTLTPDFVRSGENPFADVTASDYFYDAVLWAAENDITSGTDATHFDPDGVCTRAQAVTFLWRASGSPEPVSSTCSFTDVSASAYYYKAVLWAVEQDITKGTSDTTFSPNAECSRSQIVTFQYRAALSPATGTDNPFTDVASDAYYAGAVLWAVKEGITQGTTATTFSPAANCTRGQIVTFLFRQLGK